MKKFITGCFTVFWAWTAFSGADVTRSVQPPAPDYPQRGESVNFRIKNSCNTYTVRFTRLNADAKQDAGTDIGMPEPHHFYNFPSRNFAGLTVNGFNTDKLLPKSLTPFRKGGCAGVDALFNFDGTRVTLRFMMNDTSPLLFLDLIHDPESDPVQSACLKVNAYPSINLGNREKEKYAREIVTAAGSHKVEKGTKWLTLKNNAAVMDLLDRALEPPATPKAQGPCTLLADWSGIEAGKVWFGKVYCMNFHFTLKPAEKSWRFAFFEFKKPMSNQEYFAYKQQHIREFAFPERQL